MADARTRQVGAPPEPHTLVSEMICDNRILINLQLLLGYFLENVK
jgi:hypothetical protein